MAKIVLKSVVWKEGQHFVAQCLNVDVSTFGETREEALSNLDEALELYFEDEEQPKLNEVAEPEIVQLSVKHA